VAGGLWGLWPGWLVRDADLGGLIERGEVPGDLLVAIGAGFIAVLASSLIDGMSADKAILAGAHGRPGGQSGAIRISAVHELSHQKDGRRGSGRARMPKVIIAPPQHGQ
jgi:hypothetical protein